MGELQILREVFQNPQTKVPYPQTNGGQPRLGMLVAVVHISVTYIAKACTYKHFIDCSTPYYKNTSLSTGENSKLKQSDILPVRLRGASMKLA